jgi:hypothetical protein
MSGTADKLITLFFREKDSGRHVFNARALQALGIDPALASQRGYPISTVAADRGTEAKSEQKKIALSIPPAAESWAPSARIRGIE